MSVHGFTEETVALRLREMAAVPSGDSTASGIDISELWEVKTPPSGIPGASTQSDTSTFNLVSCKAFYLVVDGNTVKRRKVMVKGQQLELKVANKATDAIPGNSYVGVTRFVGGAFVVTWQDCNG
jgi:hypothetical protein